MRYKTGLLLTTLCAGIVGPGTASAAIFKCVGTDGEVSYNQTPCPAEESVAKVISVGTTNKTEYNCRIANNFARKTAIDMRTGQSSGDVFAAYGGIDSIPRTAIGVINYVYTHKDNNNTGPQRIAALSAARCSGGAYGPVGCDDFPYGFISELGGCEAASLSTVTNTQPKIAAPNTAPQDINGTTQAAGFRSAAEAKTPVADCKANVQEQLNALFTQMRSGQSANTQESLQDKKINLTAQLNGC